MIYYNDRSSDDTAARWYTAEDKLQSRQEAQYPRIPNAQGRGSISKNISLCTIAAPASNLFFLLERLRVYSTTTTILLHVVDSNSSQCCLMGRY